MGFEFSKAPQPTPNSDRETPVRRAEPEVQRDPAVSKSSLVVGAVDDPLEHDADQTAQRILAALRSADDGGGASQIAVAGSGEPRVRRAAVRSIAAGRDGGPIDRSTEARIRRAESGGAPLEQTTRAAFEPAFKADFSKVRIHRNSTVAPELGASAFTHGDHIHLAEGQYAPETSAGRRLLGHELAHVVQQSRGVQRRIQRSIGIEIELTGSSIQEGVAASPDDPCDWDRRDIIGSGHTWDLTLDDTPGTAPKHLREHDPTKFLLFNLEFILHGGGDKKGFPDDAVGKILAAIDEIEKYLIENKGKAKEPDLNPGRNSKLMVYYPSNGVPGSANIQLTAGASLAGLQTLLAENFQNLQVSRAGSKDVKFNALGDLASTRNTGRLAVQYVAPNDVAGAFGEQTPLSKSALEALSSMFTILKSFLAEVDDEQNRADGLGNVKEATALLWKTPLNKVLESGDFTQEDRAAITQMPHDNWVAAIVKLVDPPVTEIRYVPERPVNVRLWLGALRTTDLLAVVDKDYNRSFGGLGNLEGGGQADGKSPASHGHPIIEFRSVPSQWKPFKAALQGIADLLKRINDPKQRA